MNSAISSTIGTLQGSHHSRNKESSVQGRKGQGGGWSKSSWGIMLEMHVRVELAWFCGCLVFFGWFGWWLKVNGWWLDDIYVAGWMKSDHVFNCMVLGSTSAGSTARQAEKPPSRSCSRESRRWIDMWQGSSVQNLDGSDMGLTSTISLNTQVLQYEDTIDYHILDEYLYHLWDEHLCQPEICSFSIRYGPKADTGNHWNLTISQRPQRIKVNVSGDIWEIGNEWKYEMTHGRI